MKKLRTPKIQKSKKGWVVVWPYHPRMFSLFGMEEPERSKFIDSCWQKEFVESWEDAIKKLKYLYRSRQISR